MPAYYGETANACALDRCMEHCKKMFNWDEKYPVRDMGNGKVRAAGVGIGNAGKLYFKLRRWLCNIKVKLRTAAIICL